jgi:hypothetical protein
MNELKLPGLNKNTINETQSFIEKKVTFKQIRDNFELFKRLPFQTDLDENKVIEMKESYIRNQEYFHFKNKIVIGVVSNNFNDNYNLYVVDGQHRLEMAKDLCEDYNGELFICYYKIDSDKKMKELFREINRDSFKNNKYISLDEFQENLYDLTKDYLRSNYSLYFSEKKSTTSHRYSLTEFLNLLVEYLYFEKFNNLEDIKNDIETKNRQFNKLIDYLEYYNENSEMFYKDEHTCVKNGIIISLKNNNFINYLIDSKTVPDHFKFKNKKKTISPKLRIQVWKKYFGDEYEGVCPFYKCETILNSGLNGFHCGHIISEFNGGETNLENLKPICSKCNSKMGTEDWKTYEKKFKKEYRQTKKNNISIEI